jgi:hypothetical protein
MLFFLAGGSAIGVSTLAVVGVVAAGATTAAVTAAGGAAVAVATGVSYVFWSTVLGL